MCKGNLAKQKKQKRNAIRAWREGKEPPQYEEQLRYTKSTANRGGKRRHLTYNRKAQKPKQRDGSGGSGGGSGGGSSGGGSKKRKRASKGDSSGIKRSR